MSKALLDTDIFSELLKGKDATVRMRSANYRRDFGRYTIGAPRVTEIVGGLTHANQARELDGFRRLLESVEVLPLRSQEADLAGEITGILANAGRTIGVIDPMVAALAITNGLTLVTGNLNHFERIVALGYALVLDNWRMPSEPA